MDRCLFSSKYSKTTLVHILLIQAPGYSSELTVEAMADYEYPNGKEWQELFKAGKFVKPNSLDLNFNVIHK